MLVLLVCGGKVSFSSFPTSPYQVDQGHAGGSKDCDIFSVNSVVPLSLLED
jgi:hypothetical protein